MMCKKITISRKRARGWWEKGEKCNCFIENAKEYLNGKTSRDVCETKNIVRVSREINKKSLNCWSHLRKL
jgi:hypothetical protein